MLKANPHEDFVFISYPKSGRTWVRVIMDYLGIDAKYDHASANAAYHAEKNHYTTEIDEKRYRNRKVILIIRDPRDTIISSYYHAVYRQKVFKGTLSEFIRSKKYGLQKVIDFQKTWLNARSVPRDFLVVKYEDLHKSPLPAFRRILNFMGVESISDKKLKKAIEMFKFENMKAFEKEGVFRMRYGKILKPKNPANDNSFKVRKGKVGGYRESLSKSDIEYCGELLSRHELLPYS